MGGQQAFSDQNLLQCINDNLGFDIACFIFDNQRFVFAVLVIMGHSRFPLLTAASDRKFR